jgi:hypothetical protein
MQNLALSSGALALTGSYFISGFGWAHAYRSVRTHDAV